jgi:hypothetical protein
MSATTQRFSPWIAGVLLFLAAASRLLPHPPNFAPITAMAVYAGWVFPSYLGAVLTVCATMVASDIGLSLLFGDWGYLMHGMLPVVYASFAMIIALTRLVARHRRSAVSIFGSLVAGSAVFFVTTNFFVWALGSMYPHTLSGLLTCFTMAIPFYHTNGLAPFELVRNALVGDLLYGCLLFGFDALSKYVRTSLPTAKAPVR